MEGNPQTSFIPKKPIISQRPYEKEGVSIVTVIALIVFLGAVALAAGSFVYHKFLTSKLEEKKVTLEKAKDSFDLDTIKELQRLDLRIDSAATLLDQHIAASAFFDVLESATLKTVRFTDLSINSSNSSGVGGAVVSDNPLQEAPGASTIDFKMTGLAKSYNSVALQSDLFNKTKGFKEPIFSNLSLSEATGEIGFTVTAFLDPQVLRYRTVAGLLNENNATTSVPIEPAAPANIFNPATP